MRVVPVQSKMIELGFLEYYSGVVARGDRELFSELVRHWPG